MRVTSGVTPDGRAFPEPKIIESQLLVIRTGFGGWQVAVAQEVGQRWCGENLPQPSLDFAHPFAAMLAKVTASDAFSEAERRLKLAATGMPPPFTGFYRLVPPFWNAECGMRSAGFETEEVRVIAARCGYVRLCAGFGKMNGGWGLESPHNPPTGMSALQKAAKNRLMPHNAA